ncbi:MAG: hypothetical protein MK098_10595 [Marinovum sp.]|nr:hypothetical protein [Marinovum sp.]
MVWTDLANNASQYTAKLRERFPLADAKTISTAEDREDLVQNLAQQHDLTLMEVNQEIDDLLFVESLARQASDLRAG